MILVDTGPLVAMVDPRDGLHRRSRGDAARMAGRPLCVTSAILAEAYFHLRSAAARRKLRALLSELRFTLQDVSDTSLAAALDWMDRYADQEPDFADAVTVTLSAELSGCSVWTYDREFRTIWRRADGSPVPLAVRA